MDYNRLCRGCFHELPKTGAVCPRCGFDENQYERNRKPEVLPLNTILRGSYIVGKCLGKGGFGITYIGWHINLESIVAIKEFYPVGMVYRDTNNPDPQKSASVTLTNLSLNQSYRKSMQSFMKEARILGKLHMPGVVGVHDCFEENNTVYLVMDYILGCDLKAYARSKGGRISEEETLKLLHPVIMSLHELHQKNVIHRDISPENILLNENGEAILIDFGAARNRTAEVSGEQGKSMTVVLKPGYAPMEQYNIHGNQGPWSDVYALCATMYRMLTGTVLNDPITRTNTDDDEQVIRQNLKNNRVSARTINVLIKGLQLRVKDRYQSIQELENALYFNGQQVPVISKKPDVAVKHNENPNKSVPTSKNGKRKWSAVISIAVLLIIAAVIGIVKSQKISEKKPMAATQKITEASSEPVTQTVTEPEIQKDSEEETEEVTDEEPIKEEPIKEEPITEEPMTEEPVIEEPTTERTYLLTVEGGVIQGTDSNTDSFPEGEQITVEPEEREHYVFTGWSISDENVITQTIGNNLSFSMPAEEFTVTAEYEELTYSVEVMNGSFLNGKTSGSFREGTQITVRAEKKEGFEFAGWQVEQGNVTFEDADAEETFFTMGKEDVVISAGFVQKTYVLTVNGGTIQGTDSNTGSFPEGEQITVEPEEREHYVFTGWSVSDENVIIRTIGNNLSFSMPAEEFTITAEYEELTYSVEVMNGSFLDGKTSGSFREGTQITVKAEKKEGFEFAGWQVEQGNVTFKDAGAEETSFTIGKEDVVISADFVQKTYVLTVAEGVIQGQNASIGSFHEGDQITVEPEEKEENRFTGWTVSDEIADIQLDGDNLKFTMPAEDITVAARFEGDDPESLTEDLKNCKVGDIITFGSYEQDNNISNGKEPIEWLVLDKQGSNVLVISKYGLDAKPFNISYSFLRWDTCDLRLWLNKVFYKEAFSAREREQIEESVVKADDNEKSGTKAGKDTRDKVFLLSISEAEDLFEDDNARICYPTEYALARGAWTLDKTGSCTWWLRSNDLGSRNAAIVNTDGWVNDAGKRFDFGTVSVRPALWINLEKVDMVETEIDIQIETERQSYPVLLRGKDICEHLKRLSGAGQNFSDSDRIIEEIVITDATAPSDVETADLAAYGTPVTAWFDSQSKTIYISTKEDKLILDSDASYMFSKMGALKKVDFSRFDTSSVTDMESMFESCSSLTEVDLSNFNTSSVINMKSMFAWCYNLTELDLSNFDTSSAAYMNGMLWGCSKLTEVDLSNFDTSSVKTMGAMFSGCRNLTGLDLSNFDTSLVKNMSYMFEGCESLTTLDLSDFDASSVEEMDYVFDSCNITDLITQDKRILWAYSLRG